MNRATYAPLLVILLSGAAARLAAHHSFAAHYDMQKAVTVQGTIVEVRLTNPHSWFFLDVKEPDGTVSRWAFEAGTPSGMIRNGYKAKEMPKGSVVTITGFHGRDQAKKVGMLRQLTTADGKTFGMFGPQEGGAAR
jgi:hypothetical protein